MTLQDMCEPATLRCWKFSDVNTQRLTLLIFPVKRTKRNLMSTSRTNPSWLFNRKLGGNVLCLLLFHIICFCVCWIFSRLRLPINICWKNNASQKSNKALINSQKSIGKEWLEGWGKLFWISDYNEMLESSWALKIKNK